MPDKIVAMNFCENDTAIIGMTSEQYALLQWLNENSVFNNTFSYAEWGEDGRTIPTDPDKI